MKGSTLLEMYFVWYSEMITEILLMELKILVLVVLHTAT